MKLTKQESAMVKLAAAWMAPQMVKKATLQDKLAAYGIGLTKQAADADGKWTAPALPTAGLAHGLGNVAKIVDNIGMQALQPSYGAGSIARGIAQRVAGEPKVQPQASGALGGKTGIGATINQFLQRGVARNQAAANAGAAVGAAMAGSPAPAQSTAPATQPAAQPAAAPAGQMEAQRDPGPKPMIGAPVPTNAAIESPYDPETMRQYPYMSERAAGQYWDQVGGREKAVENARVFDDALNLVMERHGGVMDQAAVESARKAQAKELAREISAPGTNQYDDAIQMLIQAGKNNQNAFENRGEVPARKQHFEVPEGYKGPNRLNGGQEKSLRELFPAMGDTTNSRRFAGHA